MRAGEHRLTTPNPNPTDHRPPTTDHQRSRRRVRAFTLIEVLVVVALMGILIVAVTYGFVAGLDTERTLARRQATQNRMDRMEQRITTLIRGAKLGELVDDDTTYLIGESVEGDDELGADRLTLTTVAPGVSLAAQESQDDFETQQETQGPIGGVAEVSIGTTPMGDAGDLTGLFERIQRPSDNDATQGGRESLLDANVDRIGFQFYDGTQWVTSWDTITGGDRRLPAAIQVSYTVKDDGTETIHRFIVPIPASDVDANDPATNGSPL